MRLVLLWMTLSDEIILTKLSSVQFTKEVDTKRPIELVNGVAKAVANADLPPREVRPASDQRHSSPPHSSLAGLNLSRSPQTPGSLENQAAFPG